MGAVESKAKYSPPIVFKSYETPFFRKEQELRTYFKAMEDCCTGSLLSPNLLPRYLITFESKAAHLQELLIERLRSLKKYKSTLECTPIVETLSPNKWALSEKRKEVYNEISQRIGHGHEPLWSKKPQIEKYVKKCYDVLSMFVVEIRKTEHEIVEHVRINSIGKPEIQQVIVPQAPEGPPVASAPESVATIVRQRRQTRRARVERAKRATQLRDDGSESSQQSARGRRIGVQRTGAQRTGVQRTRGLAGSIARANRRATLRNAAATLSRQQDELTA